MMRHNNFGGVLKAYLWLFLLNKAGGLVDYTSRNLSMYYTSICPYLCALPISMTIGRLQPKWKSFITDDHTPVELSWQWGDNGIPPTVRFSFEPISRFVDTCMNSTNMDGASDCTNALQRALPDLDLK